jgi:NAD(P)-dependent dehydrogenase (short-subunit alcohol dehydrogenase family)
LSTDQDTGRVAVSTGASSGIGEATTRALAADGYRLAEAPRSVSTSRISRSSGMAGGSGSGKGNGQPGRGSSA